MSENYERFIFRRSWTASVYLATAIDKKSVSVERKRVSGFVPDGKPARLEFEANQFAGQSDSVAPRTLPNENGKTARELLFEASRPFDERLTTWKLTCECPAEVTQIIYLHKDDKECKNGNVFEMGPGAVMGKLIVPANVRIVFVVNRDRSWGKNEK
jgi:hypothetical protein